MGKRICIIPARGGSKRLPNKNILQFHGKPMIAYAIEAAKNSALFDKIVVTTDSPTIKKVAELYGAEVPFLRKAELSDDFTHVGEVLTDALKMLQIDANEYSFFCCIYPTSIFVTPSLLKESFLTLSNSNASALQAVSTYSYPIYRSLKIAETNRLRFVFPQYAAYRSQDLPVFYRDAGLVYWYKTEAFLSLDYSNDIIPFFVDRLQSEDIDNIEDFNFATALFAMQNSFVRKKVKNLRQLAVGFLIGILCVLTILYVLPISASGSFILPTIGTEKSSNLGLAGPSELEHSTEKEGTVLLTDS